MISKKELHDIKEKSLYDFCLKNNIKLEKSSNLRNGDETYKINGFGGLYIYRNKNCFYQFSTGITGNIIDFCILYYNDNFINAIYRITSKNIINHKENVYFLNKKTEKKEKDDSVKIEVKKDNNVKIIYAYLINTRKLKKELIAEQINKKNIIQVKTDKGVNVGFVGYNEKKEINYLMLRSCNSYSSFRKDEKGSKKEYSFMIDKSKNNEKDFYLFESPIDLLSYISLNYEDYKNSEKNVYIASGGLNICRFNNYILNNEVNKMKTNIFICFDNDNKKTINIGQNYSKQISKELKQKGFINVDIIKPETKDFNEDLINAV